MSSEGFWQLNKTLPAAISEISAVIESTAIISQTGAKMELAILATRTMPGKHHNNGILSRLAERGK